jgi:hypothetical protein
MVHIRSGIIQVWFTSQEYDEQLEAPISQHNVTKNPECFIIMVLYTFIRLTS